ncbi:MAG: transposase [Bacteroidetes bacterium]|nr:transposase [Bacteroidota bacterium]
MEDLIGTKYDWLTNPVNMSERQKKRFQALRKSTLRTARAWAIKEAAQKLWHYVSRTWAYKGWKRWLSWAMRCRLEPVKKAAKTIKNHLWGIINAIILRVSNGPAESLNSRIKTIKVRCRGFRNKQRFTNAIYFYLGGLDLYPDGVRNRSFH